MGTDTTRALEYWKGNFPWDLVLEEREREASWEETEWEVRGKEREREFDGENKRPNRESSRRERGMIMGV